jgi:hypothetical protein
MGSDGDCPTALSSDPRALRVVFLPPAGEVDSAEYPTDDLIAGSRNQLAGTQTQVATRGELFSRRATGLVRLGTSWRVLVLNFANIGLTYIWFTCWITPGVFPRSNLFVGLAIAGLGTAVFAVVLAASSSFPRSGGEYVYVSRTLHPAVGFGCSFAATTSQCFWVGIGGSWIANLVLAPVLAAFGASTGSEMLGD